MLAEPECFKRNCVHFRGARWLDDEETSEVVYCNAFPDGIPNEIAYGDNLHLEPIEGQDNDIVFEKILEPV